MANVQATRRARHGGVQLAIDGPLKINVQILRGSDPAIGPGKALVLDAIGRTGSISAAGRELKMSYRRIWLLVDSLNHAWLEPVVETRVGGENRAVPSSLSLVSGCWPATAASRRAWSLQPVAQTSIGCSTLSSPQTKSANSRDA